MNKPKNPDPAERLREVSRQLDELLKSGRTKRFPHGHKKKLRSRSPEHG